jgi:hypothetical protein
MESPSGMMIDEHHAANSSHGETCYAAIILPALMQVKIEIFSDESP